MGLARKLKRKDVIPQSTARKLREGWQSWERVTAQPAISRRLRFGNGCGIVVRKLCVRLERMFRLDDRRGKNWRSRRGMKWYPWPRIRMIARAKKLAGKGGY